MLMPPHVRATFMPNPPLKPHPPVTHRRKNQWTAVASYLTKFETQPPPPRTVQPTAASIKEQKRKYKKQKHMEKLLPIIEEFRQQQQLSNGEYDGMNCYNTLFVGRLAYEVTERKLLREMEAFGPVKDLRIITVRDDDDESSKKQKNTTGEKQSRGYAFVEYEHEDDMKRAYRAADGMKIEGRSIVVDVQRGLTVPSFLPRRLGGTFKLCD
jgi:U1 small nuclear ribonucleoprotein 70kDa